MKLLLQIGDLRFDISGLLGLSFFNILRRSENEPENPVSTASRAWRFVV